MSPKRVLGVLAGTDLPLESLALWANSADVLLAADGGADRVLELGLKPTVVIGDMDSIGPRGRAFTGDVRRDPGQETTDFDKLLITVAELGYTEITIAGIEGDLPDHFLAGLHSAARSALRVRFALRRGVGWILKPGDPVRVDTEPGSRLSLLPLTDTEAVSLSGVHWPLQDARLAPLGATSISNRTTAHNVEARLDSGAAFLFIEIPPDQLPLW